ncbi:monofunctional biosynthetic peptidoglycan transglycosylase [Eionea flava]
MNKRSLRSYVMRYILLLICGVLVLTVVLVLPLRWLNPATTSFILSDESVDSVWIYQQWTDIEDIAPMMQMAVIASEDQKFPKHYGFDFEQLQIVLSQSGGPKRGASTISQQLTKNIFLWSSRSVFRKGVEAYLTVFVELLMPKSRILELYLNVVEFGPGIYGVQAASQSFFDKAPSQLNRIDASLLAAVLPNPKVLDVAKPSAYVYDRALNIRFAIRNLGGTRYLGNL